MDARLCFAQAGSFPSARNTTPLTLNRAPFFAGGMLARQASAAGILAGKMLLQRDNLIVSVDAALTRLYLRSQKGASSRQSSGSPWRVGRPLTDEAFVNCKSRIIKVLNAWGEAQEGSGGWASGRLSSGRMPLQ